MDEITGNLLKRKIYLFSTTSLLFQNIFVFLQPQNPEAIRLKDWMSCRKFGNSKWET